MKQADRLFFYIAADIGTTNIKSSIFVKNLSSAETGGLTEISSIIEKNCLSRFGTDVISRISAGMRSGFSVMYTALQAQIFRMCSSLAEEAVKYASAVPCIERIVLTANTVMLHFITGKDPSGMALYPFAPASLFGYECAAADIFSSELFAGADGQQTLKRSTSVYIPPCIDAFVGADAVCAAAACGFNKVIQEKSKKVLLCDIGTNTETMLVSDGRVYCCSAAAGPAFEKGLIKHGLTGSALISILAQMLRGKLIDTTGFLDIEKQTEFEKNGQVQLSQKNIRDIQLAKAAAAAGIAVLLHEAGLSSVDIDVFYICGALGGGLNTRDAAFVGLFPSELSDKITAVPDAALKGAVLSIQENLTGYDCSKFDNIAEHAQCIQLGGNGYFAKEYINAVNFPEIQAPER